MFAPSPPGHNFWLPAFNDILTAICEPIVYTMLDPQHLTTL
jgi:hypothetical protein